MFVDFTILKPMFVWINKDKQKMWMLLTEYNDEMSPWGILYGISSFVKLDVDSSLKSGVSGGNICTKLSHGVCL